MEKKFFISADIEGITDVTFWSETEDGQEGNDAARAQMTREVAAACEAVVASGNRAVVRDGHGNARNISHLDLPEKAELMRGWACHPGSMMAGLDSSFGGVIYTPGSAGTMQEIFQEAVQNHYLTYGIASPMVFVGKKFWTEDMPAFTMLHQLSASGRYRHLQLALTDDTAEAVSVIKDFQQSDEAHRMKDKFGIRLTMGLK